MPFINGIFKRIRSWVADAAAGLDMLPDLMDQDADDIAAGLSNAVLRDGTGTPTADLPMGGHKLKFIGAGTDAGDAINLGQFKALAGGGLIQGGSAASGAGNASVAVSFPTKFSAQPSVVCTAVAQAGQQFTVQVYAVDQNGFTATTLANGQLSFGLTFFWHAIGPS